jgi:hypothetical protein
MAIDLGVASVMEPLTIEVADPTGQQRVMLRGVRRTATAADVVAMASARLKMPPQVPFDVRHNQTSRLLEPAQLVSDLADEHEPHLG